MKNKYYAIVSLLLVLTACSKVPSEAYYNRGDPAGLLSVSSEVVSLGVDSEASVEELIAWINRDVPTRADIKCNSKKELCVAVEEALKLYGVDYQIVSGELTTVDLIYERVMTKDCDNRYLDNHINPYKLNHQAFGCSVVSNMVSSVSDKRQFVNPELLGYTDGRKASQAYRQYHRLEQEDISDGGYSVSGGVQN